MHQAHQAHQAMQKWHKSNTQRNVGQDESIVTLFDTLHSPHSSCKWIWNGYEHVMKHHWWIPLMDTMMDSNVTPAATCDPATEVDSSMSRTRHKGPFCKSKVSYCFCRSHSANSAGCGVVLKSRQGSSETWHWPSFKVVRRASCRIWTAVKACCRQSTSKGPRTWQQKVKFRAEDALALSEAILSSDSCW